MFSKDAYYEAWRVRAIDTKDPQRTPLRSLRASDTSERTGMTHKHIPLRVKV